MKILYIQHTQKKINSSYFQENKWRKKNRSADEKSYWRSTRSTFAILLSYSTQISVNTKRISSGVYRERLVVEEKERESTANFWERFEVARFKETGFFLSLRVKIIMIYALISFNFLCFNLCWRFRGWFMWTFPHYDFYNRLICVQNCVILFWLITAVLDC